MAGKYTLELTDPIRTVLLWAAAGLLLALLLLPRRRTIRRDLRLFGLFSAIAVAATAFGGLYCNEDLYEQTQAGEDLVNPWIDAEAYLSHGAVYAFLHTVQDLVPHPPGAVRPPGGPGHPGVLRRGGHPGGAGGQCGGHHAGGLLRPHRLPRPGGP